MSLVAAYKKLIAFARGNTIFIANLNDGQLKTHVIATKAALRSIAFNRDGSLLISATDDKVLCLIDVITGNLISSRILAKNPSSVAFCQYEEQDVVLVSDKTGEAFAFPTPDVSLHSRSLLGHTTSMLTDLKVTKDSKFVITSDRDEKIRVSHFPRTTQIESYCLGHEGYVINMDILHNKKSLLVSCGGDGSLRLWNYLDGKLLDTQYLPEKFNPKFVCCSPVDNLVAVAVENSNSVFFFKTVDTSLELVEEKKLSAPVDSMCFSEDHFLLSSMSSHPFIECLPYPLNSLISIDSKVISLISSNASLINIEQHTSVVPDTCKEKQKNKKLREN